MFSENRLKILNFSRFSKCLQKILKFFHISLASKNNLHYLCVVIQPLDGEEEQKVQRTDIRLSRFRHKIHHKAEHLQFFRITSLSKEEKAHTVYMMLQMRSGRIDLVGDDMFNTWNKLNEYVTSHERNRCRFEDSIYYEMVKGVVELTGLA